MQKVTCEFHNIQSHEATRFTLLPGLNFILAEDNNVGKSTIFRVLTAIAKMPKVDNGRLSELLRERCTQGCAVFELESTVVTFWLFRDDGNKVRAFFDEGRSGEEKVRTASCPQKLLSALDIALDKNGNVLNFNDADSVQLIVNDSPKNDEILAHVLVDLDVERVKSNSYSLNREMISDYKMIAARHQDAKDALARLRHNPAVDDFFAMRDIMSVATRVLDGIKAGVDRAPGVEDVGFDDGDLAPVASALKILRELDTVNLDTLAQKESGTRVTKEELHSLGVALGLLKDLSVVSMDALDQAHSVDLVDKSIDGLKHLCNLLTILSRVMSTTEYFEEKSWRVAQMTKECQDIREQLAREATVVECPKKGKVYYSDAKCIPCGD